MGMMKRPEKDIPGWNAQVKHLSAQSREAFLFWRSRGSPRVGLVAQHMRRTRADFKFALRQCNSKEAVHRAEALSAKLRGGSTRSFWQNLRSADRNTELWAQPIDGVSGEQEIAQHWKDNYN